MKKIQGNIWFPFRKKKFKTLCSKKISTRKIAENELFWFFGRFLAFWAQKWPKIGPKIGPNNKFELWVPKRVHRRGLTPFLKNSDFFLPIPNRFKHCAMLSNWVIYNNYIRFNNNSFFSILWITCILIIEPRSQILRSQKVVYS